MLGVQQRYLADFVDFKQAHDSINRASLWNIMAEFNIPLKLIKLVKACYSNSKACVQIGQEEQLNLKSNLVLDKDVCYHPSYSIWS